MPNSSYDNQAAYLRNTSAVCPRYTELLFYLQLIRKEETLSRFSILSWYFHGMIEEH